MGPVLSTSLLFKREWNGEVEQRYDKEVFLSGFVPWVDSSLKKFMMCEGDCEIKSPTIKNFIQMGSFISIKIYNSM